MTHHDPQNPYVSFVVSASAGSGKTYQLSRRFLNLVGAGAEPSHILTVTFTKKAAGEMRGRILEEAARLLADKEAAREFESRLARYRESAPDMPPPRSATATAEAILGATQRLAISTIDALFYEWTSKFPFEAGPKDEDEAPLPSPFKILPLWEEGRLHGASWRATARFLKRAMRGDQGAASWMVWDLLARLPEGALTDAERRLGELFKQETFFWFAETHPDGAYITHPIDGEPSDEADFLEGLAPELSEIATALGRADRRDQCLAAIAERRFEALIAAKLLTKDRTLNGTTVSKKVRATAPAAVARVEEALAVRRNLERLTKLNEEGRALVDLYRLYVRHRTSLKSQRNVLEFGDLAKCAYRLFKDPEGAGARYLLARRVRHLLLDEFQDTSRLQWAVFSEMAQEMLSGAGLEDEEGLPPTVFLVGDEKQSIYGFREAAPEVMGEALVALQGRVELAPLTASYRTAQVVLDFVNEVFGDSLLEDFPEHRTARIGEAPFVPDVGRVAVAPLFDKGELPFERAEAEGVAAYLQACLAGEIPCPVWDKGLGGFRPLEPRDCAILYRASTHSHEFEKALRARRIPAVRAEERGFFARPEVEDAVALLRFLARPADLTSLLTVLKSPLGRVPDRTMLELLAATRRMSAGSRARRILKGLEERGITSGIHLQRLLSRVGKEPFHRLLSEGLRSLGALSAYGTLGLPEEAALSKANLLKLVEIVIDLEAFGEVGPGGVVDHLEMLVKEDETGFAQAGANAVQLMTLHKSKGLEFPLVVIVDAARPWGEVDPYWAQTEQDGRRGIVHTGVRSARPVGDKTFDTIIERAEKSIRDETARLLYVGLTRARQYLLVTGHQQKGGRGRAVSDTAFHGILREKLARLPGASEQPWPGSEENLVELCRIPSEVQVVEPVAASSVTDALRPLVLELGEDDSSAFGKDAPRELVSATPSSHKGKGMSLALRLASAEADADVKDLAPFASLMGDLIHAGLEARARGLTFEARDVWRRLLSDAPLDAQSEESAERAFAHAKAELESVLSDPEWQKAIGEASEIFAELPFAHRQGATLVQGQIDLVLVPKRGPIRVIDYKSTSLTGDEFLLRELCIARGYDRQVADYVAAVAALYPERKVRGEIYFTSLRRFLRLV